jgi:hypothetical protein
MDGVSLGISVGVVEMDGVSLGFPVLLDFPLFADLDNFAASFTRNSALSGMDMENPSKLNERDASNEEYFSLQLAWMPIVAIVI